MPWLKWVAMTIASVVYLLVHTWLLMAAVAVIDDPSRGLDTCIQSFVGVVFDWEPVYWIVKPLQRPEIRIGFVLPAAILMLSQFIFLRPVFTMTHRQLNAIRPATSSALTIAIPCAVLLFALLIGIAAPTEALLRTLLGSWLAESPDMPAIMIVLPAFFFVLGMGWFVCSVMLRTHANRLQGFRMHDRLFRIVLFGTVGVLVVVTISAVAFRQSTKPFDTVPPKAGLYVWAWVALWLGAPFVYLRATYKQRQLLFAATCERCGYTKGPTPPTKCPECGHAWEIA